MRRHLLSVDREEDDVGGRFSSAANPTSPTTVENHVCHASDGTNRLFLSHWNEQLRAIEPCIFLGKSNKVGRLGFRCDMYNKGGF